MRAARVLLLVLGALLAFALAASPASAAFPQDPPNDPDFDSAERNCATTAVGSQELYHYSRISSCTPQARDPENAMGMSTDRAWREVTAGRPDVTIAYIEGGVNWFDDETAKDIVNQMYLNAGELPAPTTPVDDGRLNVKDFADTKDANGNGYVDAEDLIARFSDGRDADSNGFVDDISGWDFYHDQNDPATVDSAQTHANNQMRQAAGEPDNKLAGLGVCPRCTVMPVKAGAEALDRTDDLAEAWLFAADAGADVIVSVTADLGYSTFMRQTVDALHRRGVVMVEASNDFDSTDHQGGQFHPHVLPGNAVVANSRGVPAPAANPLTTNFRARSGFTSWGTKNFVSAATSGGTTSEATPTIGAGLALILAAGAPRGITGPESVQVMRATASDVDDPSSNWPSRPGFDLQFGYGRPNLLKAAKAAAAGDIPPVGWIDSPDWYELFDPTKTQKIEVRGHVEAPRSSGYRFRLEAAPGAEPGDGDFREIGAGGGSKAFDGRLGEFDLGSLPRGFWARAMALSDRKELETSERYTVTFRLRVTDAQNRVGEERRTIAVHHDDSWLSGFPKRIGPGGEAQPVLADLQGTGRLAAIFGDSDGRVHALDGRTGEELPGWPVRTNATQVTKPRAGIEPGNEPIVQSAAVGDLDGDGRLSVVVATTTGRVYAFDARGARRAGWPKTLDTGAITPPIPRPNLPFTRQAHTGTSSPPVLVDLAGHRGLEVVQSAWNGRLNAFTADGGGVPGFPIKVEVPASLPPGRGQVRIDDQKLVTAPTVAQLDGTGRPELVIRSQRFDTPGDQIQFNGATHIHAFRADGSVFPGWPRKLPSLVVFYGSAQEFITEGAGVSSAADVDGDGKDEITVSPLFSPVTVLNPDGSTRQVLGPVPNIASALTDRAKLLGGNLPPDAPVSFTTSGAFGRFGGGLTYAEPGSGFVSVATSLLTPGSGTPITNSMRAFDARGGAPRGGFPSFLQGLDFLGAPAIADVTGDGEPEIVLGGDSSAMHAFSAGGAQAAGFPKFQTGWMLWGPSTGDLDGDGKTDVVGATREGYAFAWSTPGTHAGNQEWWAYRHDERNTSRYGTDTRPPGVARDGRFVAGDRTLRFVAPGDDWYAGTAKELLVRVGAASAEPLSLQGPRAGEPVTVELRSGARGAIVQARDEVGNLGAPVTIGRVAGGAGARACRSRRSVTITLPRGRYRSARVVVAGKRATKRRRGRKVTVTFKGRSAGRVSVVVRARRADGRLVRVSRRYRLCAKKLAPPKRAKGEKQSANGKRRPAKRKPRG